MARECYYAFPMADAKLGKVPAAVQAEYVKIIDTILASSDLNTISEKRIRKGLQQAVNYDITPQKVCPSTPTTS